ncbi:MAG: single-stranded DNA-binding protein [Oscillospiraceae bacterium]|jgi:single-strand DNA-binding protein|nr:single-stranded DNA-binding protein [Oscillospiraceae bacterium]
MNVAVLMGRLVADPELRTTQSGVSVTTFRIAVERRFKDSEGNRQADFIDIVAWRQSAEFVQKYFHKGDPILVQGSIQVRPYEDKNGNRRTAVEIQADNVSFVLKPRTEGGYSGNSGGSYVDRTLPPAASGGDYHQPAQAAPSYANAGASDFSEIETDDDDLEGLPF